MSRGPRKEDRSEEGRAKRIPLTGLRLSLDFERFKDKSLGDDGLSKYVHRIVEDKPGEVDARLNAWWEFVNEDTRQTQGQGAEDERDQTTARVRKVVGYRKDGKPKMGYLMRQEREYYEEDRQALRNERAAKEERINAGANPIGKAETDGRVVPKGGALSVEKMLASAREKPN